MKLPLVVSQENHPIPTLILRSGIDQKEFSKNNILQPAPPHKPKMPYIEFSNPVRFSFSKTLPQPPAFSMKSLFSNNAQVCYKPHSLSYGGVGTMRNSRAKARKT